MKNRKQPYKPTRIVSYEMKKQLHGGYKILEHSHMSNDTGYKKRTLYKNLPMTDAEDKLYRLESKLK